MELTDIIEVSLLEYQEEVVNKIYKITDHIFKHKVSLKFSGFLLFGPPGNGKTEIAKQAALRVGRGSKLRVYLIDGSDIASPRWGDAEEKLKKTFLGDSNQTNREQKIIIFDDIESTLMSRDVEMAKEWHFSINSVVFHLLDDVNNGNTMVIATTNKPEIVDPALRSRLFPIEVKALSKEELKYFLELNISSESYGIEISEILKTLTKKIDSGVISSLRDVEHEILLAVVEKMGE
jgi:SpoVK/Ycf46/Vps4 family AAA+-type ATPase